MKKKAALYSPSPAQRPQRADALAAPAAAQPTSVPPTSARVAAPRSRWWGWLLAGTAGLAAGVVLALGPQGFKDWLASRGGLSLNMRFIEATLRKSLEDKPLTPLSVTATKLIAPSVVRVVGQLADEHGGINDLLASSGLIEEPRKVEQGVGSGVVIIDNGTILTNLHVVQGAKRIRVTFADGHVSDAQVVSTDPQNDLAVLRALSVPDDLQAAAMRSTADLAPGEPVVAVGFPFGLGPSVSSGVVSGLKRSFRSPDGQQVINNLIQFDAAANPGNSGGPLITMDGAVVGIVTAILNPEKQRFFIGIGFAVPIENAASAAGMPPF